MIRSCVSVPVLSVHKTSIAPRFWMALRRLTTTLARAMAVAPFARLTVTIIGSISGVSPTATATANSSASSQSCLVNPLGANVVSGYATGLIVRTAERHARHLAGRAQTLQDARKPMHT